MDQYLRERINLHTRMKPTIYNTGFQYTEQNGDKINHSFSDFHEVGNLLFDDYFEPDPDDEFVYIGPKKTNINSGMVFARFELNDKEEYISLHEIMVSGSPVDLEEDREMDLLDENIYQFIDDKFQVIEEL